jgi:hypothetical protein
MALILFDEDPGNLHPVGEVRLDTLDQTVRGLIRARIELDLERVDLDKTAQATFLFLTPLPGG